MSDGPNIARIGALLGDRARAAALTALLADRALTASELASVADVTKQTMSAHLAKLLDAGLLVVESQGRHRYFRLADEDVATLLESVMGVASRTGAVRLVTGPREPALRAARVCYDHLAGELGVLAYESLLRQRVFDAAPEGLRLTATGERWFAAAGIDIAAAAARRRSFCRPCLDWSERRQHLGGALGAALLARVTALGWARRVRGTRIVSFTAVARSAFVAWLGAPSPGRLSGSRARAGSPRAPGHVRRATPLR